VLFWLIGTSVLAVGYIFRDPRFDYRLLVVGAVLPLLDGVFGGAGALHSVIVAVVVLVVVMLATRGRRPLRRLLLGLPIGMLLSLVFDGAWSDTAVFWWPLTGLTLPDEPLPAVDRGWLSLVLEVIGVAICVWIWRRNDLSDPARRRQFIRTGVLDLATS
jgi:hypothetical protein